MTEKIDVTFTVNGQTRSVTVEPRRTLADTLREDCGLTGTHLGCEHGVCGACTVLVDGMPARACLMLAVTCDDRQIHSLEGLRDDPIIAALRDSFHRRHAVQCGFCTPGMLISARDLIQRGRAGSEAEIRQGLAGNLCRCTGYTNIVSAIAEAAKTVAAQGAQGKQS